MLNTAKMLCDVCKDSLEGIWDPLRTERLGLREDFDFFEVVEKRFEEEHSEVERFVFGHHRTRDTFLHSKAAGCVQCSRYETDHDTGRQQYFSVFCVEFSFGDRIWVKLCCGDQHKSGSKVSCKSNVVLLCGCGVVVQVILI